MEQKKMITEEEENNDDAELTGHQWLDLPCCLWESIIAHLNTVDRCHVAITSRQLRTIAQASVVLKSAPPDAPFLVSLVNYGKQFHFFDPFHNEGYFVNTREGFSYDTTILSSKNGWLLLLTPDDSIFFFNAITKERIDLPSIDYLHGYSFSFSSVPTSPDCCVLAIMGSHRKVNILICRRGEDWVEIGEHENQLPFLMSRTSAIYHARCFYCLGEGGGLAVFDPKEETWNVLVESSMKSLDGQFSLVEFNGILLRLFMDLRQKKIDICRLDPSMHQWVKFSNLGDGSLFFGGRTSISSRGVAGRTGGRMYFQRLQEEKCVYYCFNEQAFHPEETFLGSEYFPRSSWMEINDVRHPTEELHW